MKIGIDIDDTTFLTVKSMLKYADIFEEEISGIPTNRDSFGLIENRYYLKALYGWDDETKFADAIINLYNNYEKLEEISKKSFDYIVDNFSSKSVLQIIKEDFNIS